MQYTKIDSTLQKRLEHELYVQYPLVRQIIEAACLKGYIPLLVGGAVRDLFIGQPLKDLDIEIYGCTSDELEAFLSIFGPVSVVGKIFGVYRLAYLNVDWSIPRADSSGRKPTVTFDPYLSFKEAFARRDLTINAIGINLATMELIDIFGGVTDLKNRRARVVDQSFFIQDPLRFFRVMQFIGRFELEPDEQLNKLCARMNIEAVSHERIESEFEKLFLKSVQPSRGIRWLNTVGRLEDVLPEVAATRGIQQNPLWHPEGDVFEHTMQTLDAAAQLSYQSQKEKLAVVYAALCHDLGKVSTSRQVDGQLVSYGHEIESVHCADQLLRRVTRNQDLIITVKKLVREHMVPGQLVKQNSSAVAYKKLALRLWPHATISLLALLALADKRGRNSAASIPLNTKIPEIDSFIQKAEKLGVANGLEEPLIHGRDLLDVIPPGPQLGKAVRYAYEMQLQQEVRDKQELKKLVIAYINQDRQ